MGRTFKQAGRDRRHERTFDQRVSPVATRTQLIAVTLSLLLIAATVTFFAARDAGRTAQLIDAAGPSDPAAAATDGGATPEEDPVDNSVGEPLPIEPVVEGADPSETEDTCGRTRQASEPSALGADLSIIPGVERAVGSFLGPGAKSVVAAPGQLPRYGAILDDGRIAAVTYNEQFMIWDPAKPFDPPQYSAPHKYPLIAIAAGPGSLVIAGDQEGGVLIFDADNPTQPPEFFDWYDESPISLEVLCDGRLVAANDSNTISIWDPVTSERTTLRDPEGYIRAMMELSDGRLLTASTIDRLRIWDPSDPAAPPLTLDSSFDNWTVQLIELDNGLIAASDGSERVQVFDPNGTGERLARLGPLGDEESALESDYYFAIAPFAGGRIAASRPGGEIVVWDPATDSTFALTPGSAPSNIELLWEEGATDLTILPSGDVITLSSNNILRVWQQSDRWAAGMSFEPDLITTVIPGANNVARLAGLADGTLVTLGDIGIRTWDVDAMIAGADDPRITAITSSNGIVVVGREDGSIEGFDRDGAGFEFSDFEESAVVALEMRGTDVAAAFTGEGETTSTVRIFEIGNSESAESVAESASVVTVVQHHEQADVILLGLASGDVVTLNPDGSIGTTLLAESDSAVTSIIELPNGRAAIATDDSLVWFVDPVTGASDSLDHPFGSPAPMAVVGDHLVTSGGQGKFRAWDLHDFDIEPIVVETDTYEALGIAAIPERPGAFGVVDIVGSFTVFDYDGDVLANTELAQLPIAAETDVTTGHIATASQTGAVLFAFAAEAAPVAVAPASPSPEPTAEPAPTPEVDPVAIDDTPQPDPPATVFEEGGGVESPGIVKLEGPVVLLAAHEGSDGTLIGIGADEAGAAVWVWPQGNLTAPVRTPIDDAQSVVSSVIVDDSWLVMAIVSEFGDEAPEDPPGRLEYWNLDDLAEAPQRVERDRWVLSLEDIGNGRFAFSHGWSPEFEIGIRNVHDPEDNVVLSNSMTALNLTVLDDGRVAGDGITIWDPSEPERDPVVVPSTTHAWEFDVLPDGRIAWGQQARWGVHDLESGDSQIFDVPDADHYVSPRALADGRLAINGTSGIEVYELADLETVVAVYPSPIDARSSEVSSSYLTYTDTHAVSFGSVNGRLWIWDLASPGVPAVTFEGGEPLLVFEDGRILSSADSGLLIWSPAGIWDAEHGAS